jgi:hypothetical protein
MKESHDGQTLDNLLLLQSLAVDHQPGFHRMLKQLPAILHIP